MARLGEEPAEHPVSEGAHDVADGRHGYKECRIALLGNQEGQERRLRRAREQARGDKGAQKQASIDHHVHKRVAGTQEVREARLPDRI